VWDHVARPHKGLSVAHNAVVLSVIATRTSRVRFGALVTPLTRRRPHDFAREATTLDHLSNGRLIVGVGLGVNTGGELERLGETTDEKTRAARLDEAIEVVQQVWTGEAVHHAGTHFTVNDVVFTPTPLQVPRIPIWVAARTTERRRPLERAARLDGLVPEIGVTGLIAMLEQVAHLRGNLDHFDVVCKGPRSEDPGPFKAAGATWWLTALPEVCSAEEALATATQGPPR
jgi:hypothetical protein